MQNFSDWVPDPRTSQLIAAQQRALTNALRSEPLSPEVGDLWLSHARWDGDSKESLSAMIVVLRSFSEAWSSHPLFDVAPVTDDERLATEWSLVFDSFDSSFGFPIILHVDVQATTTRSMFRQKIGSLHDDARLDLETLLQAYALGEATPLLDLHVGHVGNVSIRFHADWSKFAEQLVKLAQELGAQLTIDRFGSDIASVRNVDHEYPRLSASCGAIAEREKVPELPRWEYQDSPPFVVLSHHRQIKQLRCLGDAIAVYFAAEQPQEFAVQRVSHFDRDCFDRLVPLFNTELEALLDVDPNNLQHLLGIQASRTGVRIEMRDLQTVMAALRAARMCLRTQSPLHDVRMAARRPIFE